MDDLQKTMISEGAEVSSASSRPQNIFSEPFELALRPQSLLSRAEARGMTCVRGEPAEHVCRRIILVMAPGGLNQYNQWSNVNAMTSPEAGKAEGPNPKATRGASYTLHWVHGTSAAFCQILEVFLGLEIRRCAVKTRISAGRRSETPICVDLLWR